LWHGVSVLRERRDDGPTRNGGAYRVVRWDDETGDADIFEYDAADALVCRHEWRLCSPAGTTGVVGEMITFDPQGVQTGRRPLRHQPLRDIGPRNPRPD